MISSSTKNKHVILIQPFTFLKTKGMTTYSLGIYYLGKYLLLKGANVELIDFNLEEGNKKVIWNKIIQKLHKKIDILGISFSSCPNSNEFIRVIRIIDIIKKKYDELKIIVGGVFIEDKLDYLVMQKTIDKIFLGESENCIHLILENNFFNNEIIFQNKSGIQNLDEIPFPLRPPIYTVNIPILSSRGCTNNCSFCSITKKNKWRAHSPDYVIEEISNILKTMNQKKGIPFFHFIDQNMVGDNFDRVYEIAKNIISNNIKINWAMSLSTNSELSLNGLKLLSQSGLINIFVGIESASIETLERYNKKFEKDNLDKIIDWCKGLNIGISFGYIGFDNFTTMTEIKESLLFFKNNDFTHGLFNMLIEKFIPYTISYLGNKILSEENLNMYYSFFWKNDYKYFIRDPNSELLYRIIKDFIITFYPYYYSLNKINKKAFIDKLIDNLLAVIELIKGGNLLGVNKLFYEMYEKITKLGVRIE